jgi:hypothetical protein
MEREPDATDQGVAVSYLLRCSKPTQQFCSFWFLLVQRHCQRGYTDCIPGRDIRFVFDEELNDVQHSRRCGPMQRRVSITTTANRIGAALDEQDSQIALSVFQGNMQRCVVAHVGGVDISALAQECLDDIGMPALCGFKEGARPAIIPDIDLCSFCNQELDDIQISVARRLVQWASAGRSLLGFDIGTLGNQDLRDSQITPQGCNMKRGSELSLFVNFGAASEQGLDGLHIARQRGIVEFTTSNYLG